MKHENKTALLVGATGLVGNELLNCLLESPAYDQVRVFTRKPLGVHHPKIVEIEVDFERLHLYKEYFLVNDVYCCLGTTIKKAGSQDAFKKVDYDYPLELATLAKESNVEKFLIITAMGSDDQSRLFYNRVKGEIEKALQKLGLHSLHIFRPSLLLGERKEFRVGEKMAILLSPLLSLAMVGPLRKYKPIEARDVARAMCLVGQRERKGTHIYPSNEIEDISHEV
jgi:uncharacterized protein YbjT (DUF2867 family)